MIVYLDEAYHKRVQEGRMRTHVDLYEAVLEGSVQARATQDDDRGAIMAGLLPIMWSHGAGTDVMHGLPPDDRRDAHVRNPDAAGHPRDLHDVALARVREEKPPTN
jgi:hypothetical protein